MRASASEPPPPAPRTRSRRRTRGSRPSGVARASGPRARSSAESLASRGGRAGHFEQQQPAVVERLDQPEPRVGPDRVRRRSRTAGSRRGRCRPARPSRRAGASRARDRGSVAAPGADGVPKTTRAPRQRAVDSARNARVLEVDRPAVDDPDPTGDGRDRRHPCRRWPGSARRAAVRSPSSDRPRSRPDSAPLPLVGARHRARRRRDGTRGQDGERERGGDGAAAAGQAAARQAGRRAAGRAPTGTTVMRDDREDQQVRHQPPAGGPLRDVGVATARRG